MQLDSKKLNLNYTKAMFITHEGINVEQRGQMDACGAILCISLKETNNSTYHNMNRTYNQYVK